VTGDREACISKGVWWLAVNPNVATAQLSNVAPGKTFGMFRDSVGPDGMSVCYEMYTETEGMWNLSVLVACLVPLAGTVHSHLPLYCLLSEMH
jgi:hypothetical protein